MTLKFKLHIIGREFFRVSLPVYVALVLSDIIFLGIVSNFFNLNYLLLVVVVSGMIMVATSENGGTDASSG